MAIVANKDSLDVELIKKYSNLTTQNSENVDVIESDKMLNAMNLYSLTSRNLVSLNSNVRNICSNAASQSVVYLKLRFNPPKLR